MQMQRGIKEFLIKLGIMPNLIGFDYIAQAVDIIIADYDDRPKMMFVYETVAKIYKVNAPTVERNIRHAISKINTKTENYIKYIGQSRMKNSEMLYLIAYRIKEGEFNEQ